MFKISKNEWYLIIFIAIAGFVFSSRSWLLYLNAKSPGIGLLIYYTVLFLSAVFLSKVGLSVFNIPIRWSSQVLGILLISFAFFTIFNWENPYVQYVTTGSFEGASPVFFQSEDGTAFFFWHDVAHVEDIGQLRILSFVVTPILFAFVGCLFIIKTRFGLL